MSKELDKEFEEAFLEIKDWAENDKDHEEISWRLRDYLETIFYHNDNPLIAYRVEEFEVSGFDENDFKDYVEATAGTVNWA